MMMNASQLRVASSRTAYRPPCPVGRRSTKARFPAPPPRWSPNGFPSIEELMTSSSIAWTVADVVSQQKMTVEMEVRLRLLDEQAEKLSTQVERLHGIESKLNNYSTRLQCLSHNIRVRTAEVDAILSPAPGEMHW